MDKFGDGTTDMYVATLTADEVVYAGGKQGSANYNYYLINEYARTGSGAKRFWSLSPHYFTGTLGNAYLVNSSGNLFNNYVNNTHVSNGFRPAVSLESGVEIDEGGNGTKINAYSIKNAS